MGILIINMSVRRLQLKVRISLKSRPFWLDAGWLDLGPDLDTAECLGAAPHARRMPHAVGWSLDTTSMGVAAQ